jgi:hypothetical protein
MEGTRISHTRYPGFKHCYPIVCYRSFCGRAWHQIRSPYAPFALRAPFRADEVRLRLVWGRPHRPQRTRKHAGDRGREAGPV